MTEQTRPQPQAIFLVNHYMGGIHAGIQSGHAIARLLLAYPPSHPVTPLIELWDKEPWFQLFNGGFDCHLEEAAQALEAINRDLEVAPHPSLPQGAQIPFRRFHEGQRELRGTLTAVAFILPGELFIQRDEEDNLPTDFAKLLKRSKRRRSAAAIEGKDLPLEYRVGLLFEHLGFAK
jgi:hypothetical protein